MLCTLVIAIGTFPYALRAVATPWSLDQNNILSLALALLIHDKQTTNQPVEDSSTFVTRLSLRCLNHVSV